MTNTLHLAIDKPLDIKSPLRLHLDIRTSSITGRKVLHFKTHRQSDIHWSSRFCRANRLCMVLRDFESDEYKILGDAFGAQEMMKKDTWHLGPWHRQGMSQVMQKPNVTVLRGNHEVGLERYLKKPKTIFGIKFCRESVHIDAKGDRYKEEHGDGYDLRAFDTEENKLRWYDIGDTALHLVGVIDEFLQDRLNKENASVAAWFKRRAKTWINKRMGVLEAMEQAIDGDETLAGNISGHTHMMGFHRTPGGKILINDGDCVNHVNSYVIDKFGNDALIVHHRDRMEIEMRDGHRYTEYYADHGLEHFADEPKLVESEYTAKADRLLRIAYRMWPSKDRQTLPKDITEKSKFVNRLIEALEIKTGKPIDVVDYSADTTSNQDRKPTGMFWRLHNELAELADLDKQLDHFRQAIPVPDRIRPAREQKPALALVS